MGLFVPAWAGQPVVYGHPFETVDADARKAQVEAFWAGEIGAEERKAFLQDNRVRYVLFDREVKDWKLETWKLVFEDAGVRLYRLGN